MSKILLRVSSTCNVSVRKKRENNESDNIIQTVWVDLSKWDGGDGLIQKYDVFFLNFEMLFLSYQAICIPQKWKNKTQKCYHPIFIWSLKKFALLYDVFFQKYKSIILGYFFKIIPSYQAMFSLENEKHNCNVNQSTLVWASIS